MSGISGVGGMNQPQLPLQTAKNENIEQKQETPSSQQPQDQVQISGFRSGVEKVLGSPAAVVTSAANVVGGFFGGGVAGASGRASKADVPLALSSGLAYTAMGAGAGTMAGGLVGGIVGGAVGLGYAILSGSSGSMEKIAHKVGETAEKAVKDNAPSESGVKDATKNFTEGALMGTGTGAVEGFKEGITYGSGIISGVIEGTKGVVTSALGKYEKPVEEEKPQEGEKPGIGKKVLNAVLGAPRAILGTAVGVAGGVLGAAGETLDGAIQGVPVGVSKNEEASARFHGGLVRVETAIAGTVAGFAFGGPVGAGIGLVGGLITGHIINKVERKSGTDKEIAENLTSAVRYAQKDNTYENKPDEYGDVKKTTYETFRDGIEGVMTGASAGAREGFKSGFAGGKGAVDGAIDGVKGFFSAITGK